MRRLRLLVPLLAILTVAACATDPKPTPTPDDRPALFYAKSGALYVSDLTGSPARKLTDGPGDTQPAPSPDGSRVAFVRKADPAGPGGELWVLDVASGRANRLVDPAALTPVFDDDRPQINTPRWSPAGDRIAFLKATFGGGGFLLTASADAGAVQSPDKPLFADFDYAWSPDGARIAWAGGRSDVSPVDVNVLTVGATSTPVAKDTNAFSVSYAGDGKSVLFANGDARGSLFTAIPFALREGGIYTVDAPAAAKPLMTGTGFYSDVQTLPSGAVAFTETSQDSKTKTVVILGEDKTRRTVAESPADAPGPAWAGATVAYVGTAADRPLVVQTDGVTTAIDTGVDAFAWAAG